VLHLVHPFVCFLLLVVAAPCYAQKAPQDTIGTKLVLISADYRYQLPGGDLAERFQGNHAIGLSVIRRTRHRLLFGGEGAFLFGDRVIEPGILSNVITRAGQVVDQEGDMADVFLLQRGWFAMAVVGKHFNWLGPGKESGVFITGGLGYMYHKIRVQTQRNVVPQLEDEYLEGYDRATAGPALKANIGYQYIGPKRRVNFHVGLEFMAGATQPLRAFNFDTGRSDRTDRIDLLSGIRLGWTLPIDRSNDDRFHYY
jgi:hypothetical protein